MNCKIPQIPVKILPRLLGITVKPTGLVGGFDWIYIGIQSNSFDQNLVEKCFSPT